MLKKLLTLTFLFILIINFTNIENIKGLNINQNNEPEIQIELSFKKLNDDTWIDNGIVYNTTKIECRIFIENTGGIDLFNLVVTNTLPENLEFVETITNVEPFEINNNNIKWYFSSIASCCGNQYIEILYYANVINIDEDQNYVYLSAESPQGSAYASDTSTITSIHDDINPYIQITKPTKGFYIRNRIILPLLFQSIIFGDIDIEVEAIDNETGIERVEFYVDNNLSLIDDTIPYSLLIDQGILKKYSIKTIAYDNIGNFKEEEINIIKII